jgi:hypothetical protein
LKFFEREGRGRGRGECISYVLGKLSFETGGGGFLDFLGNFGVVCGVGDALAVGVLLCCGHLGYLVKKKTLLWILIDVVKIVELKCSYVRFLDWKFTEGMELNIYIILRAGVAFATCDVLVTLLSMSRAVPFGNNASCGNMDVGFWTRGESDVWSHSKPHFPLS